MPCENPFAETSSMESVWIKRVLWRVRVTVWVFPFTHTHTLKMITLTSLLIWPMNYDSAYHSTSPKSTARVVCWQASRWVQQFQSKVISDSFSGSRKRLHNRYRIISVIWDILVQLRRSYRWTCPMTDTWAYAEGEDIGQLPSNFQMIRMA